MSCSCQYEFSCCCVSNARCSSVCTVATSSRLGPASCARGAEKRCQSSAVRGTEKICPRDGERCAAGRQSTASVDRQCCILQAVSHVRSRKTHACAKRHLQGLDLGEGLAHEAVQRRGVAAERHRQVAAHRPCRSRSQNELDDMLRQREDSDRKNCKTG